MSEEEDLDDVPLQHKRPFGSGLRRNEIKFVRASSDDPKATDQPGGRTNGQSISDLYLSMVLKKPPDSGTHESTTAAEEAVVEEVCEICKLPLTSRTSTSSTRTDRHDKHHEASIAHQVCLSHSHPPSALNRSRMGLSVLESQGWDPDSRTGLGVSRQGLQYPIKAKPKDDNLGIGVVVPKDFGVKKKEKPKLLDAKKVRKMAAEDSKRTLKLQQQLFGKIDLERYLGTGA